MTTVQATNRRALEAAVSAVASSVDGRRFTFQWSIHDLSVKTGGYASIDGRLGQVHAVEAALVEGPELVAAVSEEVTDASHLRIALARGHGVLLDGDGTSFHDLPLTRADADAVTAWLDRTRPRRASLDVGELTLRPGVRFGLGAGGFDRHTFFCGQSGSGKTYALRTILEQLLLQTSLRLIVLDPNSDVVRLGELRDGVDDSVAPGYREATEDVVVRTVARGPDRLHVRSVTSIRWSRPPSCGSTRSGTARSTARSWRSSRPGCGRPARRPAISPSSLPRPNARSFGLSPRPLARSAARTGSDVPTTWADGRS